MKARRGGDDSIRLVLAWPEEMAGRFDTNRTERQDRKMLQIKDCVARPAAFSRNRHLSEASDPGQVGHLAGAGASGEFRELRLLSQPLAHSSALSRPA